ncbi:MAG: hypothetical protein KBG35_04690, partial [Thauera sp.]|nr:hypothetical protein [Thauera sp.]
MANVVEHGRVPDIGGCGCSGGGRSRRHVRLSDVEIEDHPGVSLTLDRDGGRVGIELEIERRLIGPCGLDDRLGCWRLVTEVEFEVDHTRIDCQFIGNLFHRRLLDHWLGPAGLVRLATD